MDCQRIETDGMRYLDDEMTPEERSAFEEHLAGCPRCGDSIDRFRRLQQVTRRLTMNDPTDEFWKRYWRGIYRRVERRAAWIFILVGAVILPGYEIYRAVRSFGAITIEKIAILILLAGIVLLLVSVLRERIHQHKTDRYKDIVR